MSVRLVYYYRVPRGRNAGIHVVFDQWPERVLQHRGYTTPRLLAVRPTTYDEDQWLNDCLRLQAFRYDDAGALVEEERRSGAPATFIERLQAAIARAERIDS